MSQRKLRKFTILDEIREDLHEDDVYTYNEALDEIDFDVSEAIVSLEEYDTKNALEILYDLRENIRRIL